MHAFISNTWEARLSAKQAMATCESLTENIHKLVKSNRVFHKSLVFIPTLYLQVNPSEQSLIKKFVYLTDYYQERK